MIKIIKLKSYIEREKRGLRLNLMDFFEKNNEKIKDIHFVSMKRDTLRGNHIHPKGKEWILLWEGKFKIIFYGKRKRQKYLNIKEPTLIFIPEGEPHSLKNIDKKDLFLISFGSKYPMSSEKFIID